MKARPEALDLYCCQGGASRGLQDAGFRVTGVDKDPQPRYCGDGFREADAVRYVLENLEEIRRRYVYVHASPPCQLDSACQRIRNRAHPDLIGPTREALELTGLPYTIENVGDAVPKLKDPVMLCGSMFGLARTYRHRFIEAGGGLRLEQPAHPEHTVPQAKMGRAPRDGEAVQAVGNFSGVGIIRREWGVPWMNRDGIREAVPPAYMRWAGGQVQRLLGLREGLDMGEAR